MVQGFICMIGFLGQKGKKMETRGNMELMNKTTVTPDHGHIFVLLMKNNKYS